MKLLTDAFQKSADATMVVFRRIKEKEIEQDIALPQRIADMAAKLSKEVAVHSASGAAGLAAEARWKA